MGLAFYHGWKMIPVVLICGWLVDSDFGDGGR